MARENTLAAFAAAREGGVDGVELDVRRTADGVLIVHHDACLASGPVIASLTRADLVAADPDVPLLTEVLDACAGFVVNVEIKNWPTDPDFDPSHVVADEVVAALAGRDRIVVSSFNLFTVARVHELDPSREVAILGATLAGAVARGWVDDAAERGFHGVHPDVAMATPELIDRARGAGLAVRVWTVDEPSDIERLANLGVDALITNDPATARSVLAPRTRGQGMTMDNTSGS